MRVLVIDDEALSRMGLVKLLQTRKDVEHFDFANDAIEAFDKMAENSYDVLLLDVEMPELSGFEFIDRLKRDLGTLPAIVFVTAYDEHAIRAFEKHAVDYVLKPFSAERIGEALDVAFRRTEDERARKLVDALPQLQRLMLGQSTRMAFKAKGRILFLNPDDVFAVEAEGNYVLLQRQSGSCLLRESLSVMEEELKPFGFVRIHRSVLVNSLFVEEIQPWQTGEYCLRIKGTKKEYTVTRTYKKNLRLLAHSWIGNDAFAA
jgi:two-component system, LytTR family, response regulator